MNIPIFRSSPFALISIGTLLLLGGCNKTNEAHSTDAARPAASTLDACALLTGDEIQAIQGSPIQGTKSSGNSNGGLRVSQCFYSATEFTKSVSVAVTQADSNAPKSRSAKSYWQETFGRYEGQAKEHEGDEEKRESLQKENAGHEEEEEAVPPKKIDGLGDAAYWTSTRVGGALYVLHNDAFVRISVGGADPEEKKIEKCRALAEKALARM